ncbi:MAG: hypothetical protein AAF985_09305 [Bacteroidota bacterium]
MKKQLLFTLIVLSIVISGINCKSSYPQTSLAPPPPAETGSVERDLQTIKQANTIVLYLVDPIRQPSIGEATFKKYALKAHPIVLSQKEATEIGEKIETIIYSTYDGRSARSCAFVPDFGLAFYAPHQEKRTEAVDLLISFYCDQVMMRQDGNNVFKSFDQSTKSSLQNLFQTIQPSE